MPAEHLACFANGRASTLRPCCRSVRPSNAQPLPAKPKNNAAPLAPLAYGRITDCGADFNGATALGGNILSGGRAWLWRAGAP